MLDITFNVVYNNHNATFNVVNIKRGGNLRNNLKECRRAKGYTQKRFSELLNITETQYQRIETGVSDGSIKLWLKIKELLEQPIDYLLVVT